MLAKKAFMDHCVVKFDLCDLIGISFKFNSLMLIIFEAVISCFYFKSVAIPPIFNNTLTRDNVKS